MSLSLPAQSAPAMLPQGGGAGNWIISPDKLFPIKMVNAKGQSGKRYQELLDGPMAAQARGARRYASREAAAADAQVLRDQRGGVERNAAGKVTKRAGTSRDTGPKVAWFNSSTKRIVTKPSGFTPGAGSTLMFRGDGATEEDSKRSTRTQAVAAGMLKAKSSGGTKRAADPDARYIAAGKQLKNGQAAWLKVGGPEYNRRVAAGENLSSYKIFSAAQKKEESARRSGRTKKSQSEKDAALAAAKARLADVRPGVSEFSLCVINPNSNRTVGVERAADGSTTGGARALAKAIGGEKQATSKRGGAHIISDAVIIDIIRRLVAQGRLKATSAGKKCSGGN